MYKRMIGDAAAARLGREKNAMRDGEDAEAVGHGSYGAYGPDAGSSSPADAAEVFPSIRRLDEAIIAVLGRDGARALSCRGMQRMAIHAAACMQAFLENRRDEDARVLRVMHLHVGRTGVYPMDSFDGTEIL